MYVFPIHGMDAYWGMTLVRARSDGETRLMSDYEVTLVNDNSLCTRIQAMVEQSC